MNITLQGTNLELTHELRKFIYKKLDDCKKAFGDVDLSAVHIEVEIEKTTRRHPQERRNGQLYRAEANVKVPGHFIRVEESAMQVEPAIVKMKNTLTRSIRHWREHLIERRRSGARKAKAMTLADAEAVPTFEDEWYESKKPASPYQDMFESDTESPLWKGIREDDRDLI